MKRLSLIREENKINLYSIVATRLLSVQEDIRTEKNWNDDMENWMYLLAGLTGI